MLGRMHIDIDITRIEFKKQHICRVATMKQHIAIGLTNRMRHIAITHASSIDIQILLIGTCAIVGWLCNPA